MPEREINARPRDVARQVAELARSLLGPHIDVIWFGSWPKGTARPHADLDIAVAAGRPIPSEEFGRLRALVDDLSTLYQIDLVDASTVSAAFRGKILRDGKRL